jgi:hypothetical protein
MTNACPLALAAGRDFRPVEVSTPAGGLSSISAMPPPLDRRTFLSRLGLLGVGLSAGLTRAGAAEESITLPFENGARPLVTYPGKRPLLRGTTRPPQLETPFSVFNEGARFFAR